MPFLTKIFKLVVAVAIFVGLVALVRDTAYQGTDFQVFWRAARAVWEGQPAYSIPRDGAMIFKYPPWILPVFFPFAMFSLSLAQWLWGFLCVSSLVYCTFWLIGEECRPTVVLVVLFLFWGIWAVHALDGQVTLPLLALCLWMGRKAYYRKGRWRFSFLAWALSAKIFTAFAVFGLQPFRKRRKTGALVAGFCLALSVPALLTTPRHNPVALANLWISAASSGDQLMGSAKTNGPDNQGVIALIRRHFDFELPGPVFDLAAFAVLSLIVGFGWFRASKRLSFEERWGGWLGLTPVVHPLAWFHLFVLSFPLAVIAMDRAVATKRFSPILTGSFGLILLTVVTDKTFGTLGRELELLSVKSWGVLFLALGLVLSQGSRATAPATGVQASDPPVT